MIRVEPTVQNIVFNRLPHALQKKVKEIHEKQELLKSKSLNELEIVFVTYPKLDTTLLFEWNYADNGDYSEGAFLKEDSLNLDILYHYPNEKAYVVKRISENETGYGFFLCDHTEGELLFIYEI